MTAPITPNERAAMRARAKRLHHYGGESQEASEDILAALDALDAAEVEAERLRAEFDAVIDLLPERSEAEVKAEALRAAAEEMRELGLEEYTARAVSVWLSGRADRLAAEGGADRG